MGIAGAIRPADERHHVVEGGCRGYRQRPGVDHQRGRLRARPQPRQLREARQPHPEHQPAASRIPGVDVQPGADHLHPRLARHLRGRVQHDQRAGAPIWRPVVHRIRRERVRHLGPGHTALLLVRGAQLQPRGWRRRARRGVFQLHKAHTWPRAVHRQVQHVPGLRNRLRLLPAPVGTDQSRRL